MRSPMFSSSRSSLFVVALALGVVGCSGSGVSTSARTATDTAGDTGDGSADSDPTADDTDPSDDSDDPSDDSSSDPTADDTDPTADDTDPTADDTDPTADDTDPSADGSESDDTSGEPVTIEGVWLSEGENIAPLLVELTGAMSITATFGENTFTVVTIDDQGQEVQQVGVFTSAATEFGEIYEITLEQTMPSVITVEGIYEVDNTTTPPTMRYEVVQTEPSVGAVAPTAEGGFGSTSFGADLTQVFVRQ